jgi:hypothetical protein
MRLFFQEDGQFLTKNCQFSAENSDRGHLGPMNFKNIFAKKFRKKKIAFLTQNTANLFNLFGF